MTHHTTPTIDPTTRDDRPLAVVTGASSGIGLELARQFVDHHFDVIVAAVELRAHSVLVRTRPPRPARARARPAPAPRPPRVRPRRTPEHRPRAGS